MMRMKTFVLLLFMAFVFVGVTSGIILSQQYVVAEKQFESSLPVEVQQVKSASTNPNKIKAMLKGSIYESGEQVTVFGACYDGWGYLLPGANATFSSWYPNGTLWHDNVPMTSINNSGRWRIQMNMSDTRGTYLTQIKCNYQGDYALAFGEWQNPRWVARIKETQDSVANLTNLTASQYNNLSNLINEFWNETQVNFSQVLDAIDSIDITFQLEDVTQDLTEVYNIVHSLDTSFWVIDTNAPWYSFGSGVFNFRGVDMLSPNDVFAVSEDGYAVYWDGETWAIQSNFSQVKWYGVSVLPASTPYAWYTGTNTSTNTSVYSVNGGAPATISGSSGNIFYDVKIFPDPNNPSANFMGYILEDDGTVWFTSDAGTSFSNPVNFSTSGFGRLSQIIDNTDLGVTSGYRVAMIMGNELIYYNGTGYEHYFVDNQTFADVELVYDDEAYIVSKDNNTQELNVFKYNGSALELVYKVNDTSIQPRGIAAASPIDIWIVTNNPSVFYHYDGVKWEYSNYPYSGAIGLSILFSNGTIPGLYDISVFNAKNAYAVGTDGLIMKYYSMFDERFDEIMSELINLTNIYELLVTVNESVNDLEIVVNYINATTISINDTVNDIVLDLADMNITLVNISGELYDVEQIVLDINTTVNQINSDIVNMNQTLVNMLYDINVTLIDMQTTINYMNESLVNLTNIVLNMNASITGLFNNLSNKIDLLNTSMHARFDDVIANLTYIELYLNSTIYPTLNATYQNTILILQKLGIIEGKLNQTIAIVNETNIWTEELVNKSRRIHAWITV